LRCEEDVSIFDREWIKSLATFAVAGIVLAAALWLTARFASVYFAQMSTSATRNRAVAADRERGFCLVFFESCCCSAGAGFSP